MFPTSELPHKKINITVFFIQSLSCRSTTMYNSCCTITLTLHQGVVKLIQLPALHRCVAGGGGGFDRTTQQLRGDVPKKAVPPASYRGIAVWWTRTSSCLKFCAERSACKHRTEKRCLHMQASIILHKCASTRRFTATFLQASTAANRWRCVKRSSRARAAWKQRILFCPMQF